MIKFWIFLSSEDDKYNILGGIGTYIGCLSQMLRKQYPEMKIYWLTKSNKKDFFESRDGIESWYFNNDKGPKLSKDFKTNREFNGEIENYAFQSKITKKTLEIVNKHGKELGIIESPDWEGLGNEVFQVLNSKNVLKVARIHTPLSVCSKYNKQEINGAFIRQYLNEYRTLVSADLLSACTKYVLWETIESMNLKGLINKTTVIPNLLDSKNFKYKESGKKKRSSGINKINKILKEKFLSKETLNILIIGSVEKRKGSDLFMKCIPALIKKFPHIRICYVGRVSTEDGNLNKKLSIRSMYDLIPEEYSEYVKFTGFIDRKQLSSIIDGGDLFPILYLTDNFPGVVTELALKKKCIVYLDKAGVSEMLSDAKNNTVFSLGSDTKKIEAKLLKAINKIVINTDLPEIMGANLFNHITKKYSNTSTLKTMVVIYESYLSKKRSI